MKVNKEQLEGNKVALDVEVNEEKVAEALQQAYKKIVKEVDMPGFRKGKVPRKILEQKYGKEVLHKDALDILIPQGYQEAVQESDLEPIAKPEITDVFIEEGKPATFTAEVEVKPEVELGNYTDLDVEEPNIEVTDEQIEQELEARRQRHSQLVAVDRDIVESGDFTTIDFEGKIDGEVFEGGTAEDYNLEIGSEQFIPGFEDQLVGVKVGQEVEVEVTFPESYHNDDVAGKDAVFTVTVKEIKEKEAPELDDEFAKDLEFDSLADLKDNIKEDLKEREEQRQEREYQNQLVDAVAENSEVDIPETMVENEIENMLNQFKMQAQQQGIEFEQYLQMTGMDENQLREQHREEAENRAKSNLVLEAIAEEEGIEVTEDEIDDRVADIAEQQGQDKDQIKAFLQMQGQLDSLRENLKMQKAIDFLAENN
ncbi:trigger factor [Halobacteroides halobius DSM 5150]|uniref:Trigger factor n=1 Tax=Halobacteroides halobius (strain ATCC 35273 / DSM 5150 / MD-1) TaxID=748449 RepID=L0KCX5_HALHC|nr:trigger factor [Halobacteroides halobius]AGB41928.1 trigger factor [Halobacteroides halobius DSM 5150]